jgi:hypothetical protein
MEKDFLKQDTGKSVESVEGSGEKPFFRVIVHSFFIIPFLIAVFCLLLFGAMHLLTRENRDAYDYLEDVKVGGMTKRWQAAFELSKMLVNAQQAPKEKRFINELIAAFNGAKQDDPRVRQYLALAMGRTQNPEFLNLLLEALDDDKDENLPTIIYALGMLKQKEAALALAKFVHHSNARIRSLSIAALGHIGNPSSQPVLKQGLIDAEANVQWGAALALAQMGDFSGKDILFDLLDRRYLDNFKEVNPEEQNQLIMATIQSASLFDDGQLQARIREISQTDKNMQVRAYALQYLKSTH